MTDSTLDIVLSEIPDPADQMIAMLQLQGIGLASQQQVHARLPFGPFTNE